MKSIIILCLIVIPLWASGQKIMFNSEILDTKDSSVAAVRDLWESYVTNCQKGFDKSSIDYWNKNEIDQGFTDIVKSAIGFPSYLSGELTVFDIKKVDNDYYRIRNVLSIGVNTRKYFTFIFSVYAKKEINGYKLFNSFSIIKPNLQHFQADNIDFYYPNNYSFNSQKAKQMADNYTKISTLYGNKDKHRVTYLIGNNLDEANNFIGFDYTIMSSPLPSAAYIIKDQNIILASHEDKTHEIIHSIFKPMFPEGRYLFHEGIATYYGGSSEQNFATLVNQLREMISKKPDIDLSKIDDLDKVLDNGTNYYYTIGAIFIDYALKKE